MVELGFLGWESKIYIKVEGAEGQGVDAVHLKLKVNPMICVTE